MEKKFPIFKKITLLLMFVLGMGTAFADAPKCAANTTWGEFKTEIADLVDGYYQIDSPAKLAWFACEVTKGNYKINAKLTQFIDLQSKVFIPIGAGKGDNGSKAFQGIFDGQGFIISNLYINTLEIVKSTLGGNKDYAQNVGFVGVLGGGTVKNLILENVDIQASTSAGEIINNKDQQISVGAVVGWMAPMEGNVVENCMVSGTIKTTGKGQGVGGIVGNAKTGSISNCMSLVEIQTSGSQAYIGGIIGITKTNVSVSSCVYAGPGLTNTGSDGLVGGIAGNVYSGTLTTTDDYFEGESYGGIGGSICTKDCTPDAVQTSINNAHTTEVNSTNMSEVACVLNGSDGNGNCKTEPWSVGETGLSLNGYGIDGYKIVFDANGGTFADGSVAKNKFLEKDLAITADEIGNPSRDFYTFIGWAFTQDATESENLGVVSKRDLVYAVWEEKVKVTFDANGGTFPDDSETKDVYISKNSPITVDGLGSLPVSYCKQYSQTDATQCVSTMYFMGWMNDAGEQIDFNNHDVLATVNVKYNAVWTDVETYSVTFHSDDNTTVDFVQWVDAGHTVARPADPTMDGYTFLAWYDGNSQFDFSTEINTSKDLHAHWSPKQYDISYNLSEGCSDKGENPKNFTLGEGLLPLNPPTVQEGYVFDDWFYDGGFAKRATSIDRDVVGDKAFYAKCSKKTYRIKYMADNNSYGSTSDQYVEHGSSITLASEGIFWRTGYKQDGWSRTAGGDRDYVFGNIYTITEELVLYPHWVTNLTVTHYGAVTINDYGDHKEAVIDGAYTGEGVIDIPENITVSSVVFNRAFTPNTMSTLMLPFSIGKSKVKGGDIYRFKYVEMDKNTGDPKTVHIGRIKTENVGANTPYLVLPTAETMTFEGPVTFNTTTPPLENAHGTEDDPRWEFKGVYAHTNLGSVDIDYTKYAFAGEPKVGIHVGKFVELGTNANSNPMRAYLVDLASYTEAEESLNNLNKYAGGRNYSRVISNFIDVEIEDENGVVATGKLNTVTGEFKMDCWFDLKGRKYNSKPSVKGTYYKNGKKVIIK